MQVNAYCLIKKSSLRIQTFLLVSRRQGRWPGGTSGPQKFHTDDVNQCLHNKSGSHGDPNVNLLIIMFLLVDHGKVLRSTANELQQNSDAFSKTVL